MDKLKQGIEEMQNHNYEEAARLFTESIDENPKQPVGYINFGNLLTHMNDYERAARFLIELLSLMKKPLQLITDWGMFIMNRKSSQKLKSSFFKPFKKV
ncbi:hypothetical protein SAMN05216353_10156 [Halobacillus alkaliphilus]|uniref:Uncharacterized protein n=1 Tax=Halobacillus alkaliphilus TaxID=396056 RepID=A0A1I2JFV2_9BACI|nr:hypothetical protein SAMN05216353_10156 [Halobacillus alkaliphilus]